MRVIMDRYNAHEDATLGVPQSARPLVVASVFAADPRPTMVVVSGEEAAQRFARAISAYLGRQNVHVLPQRPDVPWQDATPSPAVVGRRCRAIHALDAGDKCVVVASARALLRCVPPAQVDAFSPLVLEDGADADFEALPDWMVAAGYQRLEELDGPGTFTLRGDTLEVFPADSVYPVRAEFFGDTCDGLFRLVPSTGQSIGKLERVDVYPCRELALSKRSIARAVEELTPRANNDSNLAARLELLQQGVPFGGMEAFLPYLYAQSDTPFAHMSPQTLVVLAEPRALFDDATRLYDELSAQALAAHMDLAGLYVPPAALDFGTQQRLTLLSLLRAGATVDADLQVKRPELSGTEERLLGGLRGLIAGGYTVVFSVADHRARQAMRQTLSDAVIPFSEVLDYSDPALEGREAVPEEARGGISNYEAARRTAVPLTAPRRQLEASGIVNLVDTDIPTGLVIPQAHLGIVALADAGNRSVRRTAYKEVDPTSLTFPYKPGDYVVHATHGVALFKEMVRREVAGVERDYLLLVYAEGDKLFVPVEQVDQVTRYVGTEGTSPRLTRLNTSDWSRMVGKARKSARKLAFDLVDLYSRRSTVTGFRYSPDTPWQHEMEESFPYQETPDQLQAISDVKADMESDKPMDRLVCGDVGFGKTEVVLRAAFKAVQDKRQVMVLCPTTILAQQHYTTFSERFTPFNVSVEVLSRFRTTAQQNRALEGFADGSVDVLIGTHRLLSRDVNPQRLGLIIIDEEQRFGVQHKEQLKNLREQVDVITLSATPIPRTMQMALSGVRDMSLIQTPPPERTPVKVHVGEWDGDVVSAAIRNEMARHGQTYYVSNRVKGIDEAVMRVQEAAPEARVGVAHGQMHEHELEAVMEAFAAGQIDVLVATTIIESGLDNPHTNTLIIEDSQRLGLAQLYQLKGRVGRSFSQAYAYFLFPSNSMLTEEAADRLGAIAEFQELGSGTKIAMRDLEIRGAGNIFGAEQSGNMSNVGFDLFSQMLADAVAQARGEQEIAYPDIHVDLPGGFFLPEEYIPAADERVLYYRKLAGALYVETVDKIADEVRSRYGAFPLPAANLFDRARLKTHAAALGVTHVAFSGGRLLLEPLELDAAGRGQMAKRGGVYLASKHKLTLRVPHGEEPLSVCVDLMGELAKDAEKQDSDDE